MSRKKNLFTKFIGKIHLILGLAVGSIVLIASITGCLYAFQKEIDTFFRKDIIYHHEPDIQGKKVLPLASLEKNVMAYSQEKYPVYWVEIPLDKQKSYIFTYLEMDENAWNYFDEFVCYKTVYINPYSGKVLKMINEELNFFHIVKYIHYSLLLQSTWGKYIVGIPCLIFILMLLSGLYLWWPKSRKAIKQRFWFRWKNVKNWKRKNYDLHNILGFYVLPFALVLTITGAFYSFFFVQGLIFSAFAKPGETFPDYSAYIRPIDQQNYQLEMLDKISKQAAELHPAASSYFITFPYEHLEHTHPEHPYEVYIKELDHSYHISHMILFDPNTAELLKSVNYKDKSFAHKVVDANYDIHIGAIGGIWGKILAFTTSAICATLPLSGFMIWYGRRKKKRKKNQGS